MSSILIGIGCGADKSDATAKVAVDKAASEQTDTATSGKDGAPEFSFDKFVAALRPVHEVYDDASIVNWPTSLRID